MKLLLKTLKKEVYEVEAEGSDTVAALYEKVLATHGIQVSKLVYTGKVLADQSSTIESWGIKDGDFLVLLPAKAGAKPAATPAATPAPAPTATPTAAPTAAP
eukprot:CAMPEP_0177675940 /NCGR_PEP_ID=MMETSP0447-20121125/27494_1 /TAXON_ID=0 /ORGANISM="Stygamoeba regulata, Strain BSH-02190019" /LENGTH=101 /DNA_ID=CAMNT_0019184411 /DNA_START=464 /DNA_END=765 /DNA_ORIENTATION=+